jgi:hypothetical protein
VFRSIPFRARRSGVEERHGLGNPLYQQGQIDKLKRYCLDDVRLTREVYEHGCRHGQVVIPSRFGDERITVPVTWGQAPAEAVRMQQQSLF